MNTSDAVAKRGFTQESIVDLITKTVREIDDRAIQEMHKEMQSIKVAQEQQAVRMDKF